MSIQYFGPDSKSKSIIEALRQDGAAIISKQVPDKLADQIMSELRQPFDSIGRYDESDFNGYKTLRVSSILAISPSALRLNSPFARE